MRELTNENRSFSKTDEERVKNDSNPYEFLCQVVDEYKFLSKAIKEAGDQVTKIQEIITEDRKQIHALEADIGDLKAGKKNFFTFIGFKSNDEEASDKQFEIEKLKKGIERLNKILKIGTFHFFSREKELIDQFEEEKQDLLKKAHISNETYLEWVSK